MQCPESSTNEMIGDRWVIGVLQGSRIDEMNIYYKWRFNKQTYMIGVKQSGNSCLYMAETGDPIVAQSTRLDPSVVPSGMKGLEFPGE